MLQMQRNKNATSKAPPQIGREPVTQKIFKYIYNYLHLTHCDMPCIT